MNSLRRFVTTRCPIISTRRFASESKEPFLPPPPEPDRRNQVLVRNTLLVICTGVFAFIFLKPWDGQSILDVPPEVLESQHRQPPPSAGPAPPGWAEAAAAGRPHGPRPV